jgi:hypothetical protein
LAGNGVAVSVGTGEDVEVFVGAGDGVNVTVGINVGVAVGVGRGADASGDPAAPVGAVADSGGKAALRTGSRDGSPCGAHPASNAKAITQTQNINTVLVKTHLP